MQFFRTNVRHIEVIINKKLEKIYFPLLPFCHNLTSTFRDDFNESPDLDRSSAKAKIDGLLKSSEKAIHVMKHEEHLKQAFKRIPFTRIVAEN